ncbi:MAG: DUF4252 domain-containing protein [Bacteroidota bacterium]
MNKSIIFLALNFFVGGGLMAQTTLTSFEEDEAVSSVIFNKPLFDIMAKVGLDTSNPKDLKFINAIDNIDSIRVFATRSKDVSVALKASVDNYVSQNGLTLTNTRSGLRFYKKSDGKKENVNEFMMFSDALNRTKFFGSKRRFNTIFVQLSGTNIKMENLWVIVEKLDLPEELLLWNE